MLGLGRHPLVHQHLLLARRACEGSCYEQCCLGKRGILNCNFETSFAFGDQHITVSLLFEIHMFDFQIHFQQCIMHSTAVLLVHMLLLLLGCDMTR